MIFDGITLVEGSEIRNLVVASGPSFPAGPDNPPDEGELFFKTTATEGLHIFKNGSWIRLIGDNETLADSLPDQPGLVAGDYRQVTVNLKGLVTAGINPTTLAGYGITDAQPLDADLTAIANLAGISGVLRKTGVNTWVLDTGTYLTGNETITLSGDASGSGTTAITVTLANSGVAAGSYGSASQVAVVGVDSKGRVTSASQTPIQVDASAVTSGTFANGRISQTSVTQHQAALTITESQITDGSILARNGGNETITGTWAFTNPVSGVSPTDAAHLVTKSYADNLFAGNAPPAVDYGLTSTGTDQAGALALTNPVNVVSTVSANTGVRLPNVVGQSTVVINRGANDLRVYPLSGASIDAQITNTPTIVPVGARIMFIQVSSTEYFTLNATYA